MKAMTAMLVAAVLCCAVAGHAVPPAQESQFGNPEEPALRIVKWPWLGLKKMVARTHEGVQERIHKCPRAAISQGASGLADGTWTLVEHTAQGLIYAPLPPKTPLRTSNSYEEQALAFIEAVTTPECEEAEACEEDAEEAACAETDVECADAEAEIKYLPREIRETDVEKAQRRYVPDRFAHRDRPRAGGGNLLRLAR